MAPKVSVLMPVYNAERYLAAAFESILQQTWRDFELIAVEDGSSDQSLAILRRFELRDRRVRVISRPNTGIVGALNDGLAAASGEFIGRMDADDLCHRERLKLQVDYLDSHSDVVLVGSCAKEIDPEGHELGTVNVPLTHEGIEAAHIRGSSRVFHPAAMMRKSTLDAVGRYRKEAWPAEDLDLWLRLAEVGRVGNLPQPLFIWRRSCTGIYASNLDKQRGAIEWILRETWNRRNLPGHPQIDKRDPSGPAEIMGQWAWHALRAGNLQTARKHALQSWIRQPMDIRSWRLLFCVVRGR